MKKVLIGVMILVLMCFKVDAVEINRDDVAPMTYIIGEYMFTRDPDERAPYKGTLSADYIMYAAKSIQSNDFADMIIYYKNADGDWYNSITRHKYVHNDEIDERPNVFNITYKDGLYYSAPDIRLCHTVNGEFTCNFNDHAADYLDWYENYENGVLTYYLDTVVRDDIANSANATFELFEKNGDDYTALSRENGYYKVEIEIGEVKTYVSRYYVNDSEGNPIYSDYSNELVLGSETVYTSLYGTPVLYNSHTTYDSVNRSFVVTLVNDVYNKCRDIGNGN